MFEKAGQFALKRYLVLKKANKKVKCIEIENQIANWIRLIFEQHIEFIEFNIKQEESELFFSFNAEKDGNRIVSIKFSCG